MKIFSWNVNGIRAIKKKGFHAFIEKYKPDILCLQETKAHTDQQQKLTLEFYEKRLNALEENLEKMRNGSH